MNNIIMLSFLRLWSMGDGKGAQSFYRTVEAYRNAGWNVVLISPTDPESVESKLRGVHAEKLELVGERFVGVRGLGLPARLLQTVVGGLTLYRLARKVMRRDGPPDIVYSYEVQSVWPGRILSRLSGGRHVTRFQGTILGPVEDSWFERLRRFPHFSALKTRSDLVIMTDDGTQGDRVLDRLGNGSQRAFWRNGVERHGRVPRGQSGATLRRKLDIDSERFVLVTVSRLARWKRVDRAVKALAQLVWAGFDVSLVVVGDGSESSRLRRLAEELGVSRSVNFVGSVPQDEVSDYMSMSNAFLSLYELSNLGNPLFEAMFAGKPIVTIDVGDTSKVVDNGWNGVLLPDGDIDGIARSVSRLLEDPVYASQLGRNAREFAERELWSWDERMATEVELVRQLVPKMS